MLNLPTHPPVQSAPHRAALCLAASDALGARLRRRRELGLSTRSTGPAGSAPRPRCRSRRAP
eukprot:6904309-Alexandrium_andersonii.AAC.1